jgi:hypothetical protein
MFTGLGTDGTDGTDFQRVVGLHFKASRRVGLHLGMAHNGWTSLEKAGKACKRSTSAVLIRAG